MTTLVRPPPIAVEPWSLTPPEEFVRDGAPTIASVEVPDCPVCSGSRFSACALGFDYELRTCRNTWRLVRCDARGCGHVWLNPRPADSTLATIYPPHYYAYRYQDAVPGLALRIKNAMDRRKFDEILRLTLGPRPGPLRGYADIGCGDGRFLRFARAAGAPDRANFGLELDERVVDRLNAEGFTGVRARVEECRSIPEHALDLATMFHVIEHVDDPLRVVREVARWLAPGGVLALETPNLHSLDARTFGRTFWGGFHIPRHWNLFSPETLAALLTRAGLEVIATRFQTGHSFWLYSLHHALRYSGGGSRARRALSRAFDPFAGTLALPALGAFTGFEIVRRAVGCRTSSMLMLARKPAGDSTLPR